MPFIEGESLRDRVEREHQLQVEDAVRVVREAGEIQAALELASVGQWFGGHCMPAGVVAWVATRVALRGTGAISALVSVLTETDDADDPLAETLKALLDGHIVLSRELAEQGQLPAIDIQRSVSRYFRAVTDALAQALASEAVGQLATYASSRSLVESGMYKPGMNARLDRALACRDRLLALLRQSPDDRIARTQALQELAGVLNAGGANG